MITYKIPVHSFVDLITNSSSEAYVSADQKTLVAIERLIDEALRLGGSKLKSKDIVTLSLEVGDDEGTPTKVVCTPALEGSEQLARVIESLQQSFPTEECMC